MILRIWYLGDAPEVNCIGNPYLHREVEDWIARIIPLNIDPQKTEAPDLAVTDAAGVTTFVAAFGLDQLATVEVQGMGLLGTYPGELVFVGIAQKLIIAEPAQPVQFETEEIIDANTGQRIIRPRYPDQLIVGWDPPRTELRLRGLVVDKTTEQQTYNYIESRMKTSKNGKVDIML
jgi:hypothetical protein